MVGEHWRGPEGEGRRAEGNGHWEGRKWRQPQGTYEQACAFQKQVVTPASEWGHARVIPGRAEAFQLQQQYQLKDSVPGQSDLCKHEIRKKIYKGDSFFKIN